MTSTLVNTLYNFCTGLFVLDLTNSAVIMSMFMAYAMLLSIVIQSLLGETET